MKSYEESGPGSPGRSGSGSAGAGYVLRAHATGKVEHQLSEYVARLGLDECAEILAARRDE